MVRVSHPVSADFDDPNLVSTAGFLPVIGLAEEAGLHELLADRVRVPGPAGANAAAKVPGLVAGMVARADSIADMGLLRHGGMGWLFTAGRAPTTLGTHLRAYTFGHVCQLDAVASRFLATLSTPTAVPVIAGTAAPGHGCLGPRGPAVDRRGPGHREEGGGHRGDHRACRQCVLQPRPEVAAAPAHRLALAGRLGEPIPPCPPERYRKHLMTHPDPTRRNPSGKAGQTGEPRTPKTRNS